MIALDSRYRDKLVSAEEAIRVIQSGQTVVAGGASSEAIALVDALMEQADRLENVRLLLTGNALREPAYLRPGMEKHFTQILTLFPGGRLRHAIRDGRVGYVPNHLILHEQLIKDYFKPDVALIMVSPPDRYGFCSMGITCDRTVVDNVPILIAEMNHMLPRPFGDGYIHVSRLHRVVESSRPLLPEGGDPIGEKERTIGAHVSSLIPDGGVLQIGRGSIPDAVLEALRDHKDIGVHSGMLSDTMVDLVEGGAITGARKEIDRGKMISMMAIGTDKIYSYMDQNPLIELRPISYTHNTAVIAKLSNFIALNSAVEIDLRGQVNAERVGSAQLAAPGGQPDFVRGATYSRGGRSILAMASATADDKVSKIVPLFPAGTMITTAAYDADYVVTEYGVAHLRGKSILQRAKALVSIAHPKFRDELLRNAKLSGEIRSPMLGRRRIFPLPEELGGNIPITEIYNYPIQTYAADYINEATIEFYEQLYDVDPTAFLMAQVHDALYAECNEDRAEDVAKLLLSTLTKTKTINGIVMEFTASAKVKQRWGAAA